jgi:hypothetical protein
MMKIWNKNTGPDTTYTWYNSVTDIIQKSEFYIIIFLNKQVWTQTCAVQKASVGVNISYY